MTFVEIEVEHFSGETTTDVLSTGISYSQQSLSPGTFSFTMGDDTGAEDYLIGSKVNILYRGQRVFRGEIQEKDFDLGEKTITFKGTDLYGMLSTRKIGYEFRSSTEISSALDTLFNVYWRKKDGSYYFDTTDLTAQDFDVQMDFNQTPMGQAIKQLCDVAYIGERFGFCFWVDPWDKCHFEPYGYEKLDLRVPILKERFNRTSKELITSVVYVGRQGAFFPPDRDYWTEYANSDDVNLWWDSPATITLSSEKAVVKSNIYSIQGYVTSQANWEFSLDLTGSSSVERDFTKVSHFNFWFRYGAALDFPSGGAASIMLSDGNDIDEHIVDFIFGDDSTPSYRFGCPSAIDTWGYVSIPTADFTYGVGQDWSTIRYIYFTFTNFGSAFLGSLYIDGVHFERRPIIGQYPVPTAGTDNYGQDAQIDQFGLRQLRLIDGSLWDQTACDTIAENLWRRLSVPLHSGNITFNGIIPDVIGRYVTRDIKGALFDLYINSYKVSLNNGVATTQLSLGQPQITWKEYMKSIGRKATESKEGTFNLGLRSDRATSGGTTIPTTGDDASDLGCTDGYMGDCEDMCTTGAGDESGTESGNSGSLGQGFDRDCMDVCQSWRNVVQDMFGA